jgi:hypothetical protein
VEHRREQILVWNREERRVWLLCKQRARYVSLCSGIGLALSLGLLLDDVLESLTQTNVEVKRPKYSSRSRDRDVLGKKKFVIVKREMCIGK